VDFEHEVIDFKHEVTDFEHAIMDFEHEAMSYLEHEVIDTKLCNSSRIRDLKTLTYFIVEMK
jgi:hypothetical protein